VRPDGNKKLLKNETHINNTFLLISAKLVAQNEMVADTNAVNSISGIVKEVLRLISGEKGKSRNCFCRPLNLQSLITVIQFFNR
jgi:hypothetical protein